MPSYRSGASRELSLLKLGGLIHRGADRKGNPRCAYCWDQIDFNEDDPQHTGTIDHVHPLRSKRLIVPFDDPKNLVTACRGCNAVKGKGDDADWRHFQTYLENKGIDVAEVMERVSAQLDMPIDELEARLYAERYFPRRREYLLNSTLPSAPESWTSDESDEQPSSARKTKKSPSRLPPNCVGSARPNQGDTYHAQDDTTNRGHFHHPRNSHHRRMRRRG
jgi:hypothetical protein